MFIVVCLWIDLSARKNFLLFLNWVSTLFVIVVDVLLFDCLLFTEFQTDSSTHTCLSIKVSERAQTTSSRRIDFVNEIFYFTFLLFCFTEWLHSLCFAMLPCMFFFSLFFPFRFCTFVNSLFLSIFLPLLRTLWISFNQTKSRSITFWAMHIINTHTLLLFFFLQFTFTHSNIGSKLF